MKQKLPVILTSQNELSGRYASGNWLGNNIWNSSYDLVSPLKKVFNEMTAALIKGLAE